MNSNETIKIQNLYINYPSKNEFALEDINLEIPLGKIVGIIGPNGAGKSTLMKAILDLVKIKEGQILIKDKPLKNLKKQISYVPQRESVDWNFPIDVLGVVVMGTYNQLGWFKNPGKKEEEKAREALKKVKMEDYEKTQIGELSGGQQQRVFLARSLVSDAEFFFLDEPMAGVDALTEKTIIENIKNLKKQGKTIIMVHHNLSAVKEYFDEVILLNKKVVAYGETKKVFTPENLEKTYGGKILCL